MNVNAQGVREVNGLDATCQTDLTATKPLDSMYGIHNDFHKESPNKLAPYVQEPTAVVSMACRLPDKCHNPKAFWSFLEEGKVAMNTPPGTRFSLNTHYNGSLKPQTMASPGGMFLQDVDLRDIDAQFFRLSGIEASSMDPQQRQLLEVVYEGLENGGVTLEQLDGAAVGCFVSSFASDFADIQARDPENRASATVVGVGRAMLSNRLSHFLNIKGPRQVIHGMTIDTACSGALIGLDLAIRYLQTREISSAIVAGANLYCSPEHVMDHYMGANGAASLSGKCHTFDEKADGYIKAEAVSMVYLKRLDDAIRDRDPIRAVIRGTATNSDGWTAGIASPNPEAQSAAIRQSYRNAGIADLSQTSYIEFHGTGTRAGDSLEANGVASVFAPHKSLEQPLRIGSVKSNIGHSEPAAGLSGLLKTILSLEKGIIPGNPTFIDPSPKIDFKELRLRACYDSTPWPIVPFRRAGVNSFGYGGSNAHVIIDEAKGLDHHHISSFPVEENDDFFAEEKIAQRPYLIVLSANDEKSLEAQFSALDKHSSDPAVRIEIRDLAYTLSERRSRHYHRGFISSTSPELKKQSFIRGHIREEPPTMAFIFTGQGAQWSQMGKDLMETFPLAASTIRHLDQVLQNSYNPPKWTLHEKLVSPQNAEDLRRPDIAQPLATALQLAILAVLAASNVSCHAVAGHSSGEIAAAVAAGHLTADQAIKIAYYRGMATAATEYEEPVGMMAVGLGPERIEKYLAGTLLEVACFNSPQGLTLSGSKSELLALEQKLKDDGHFARVLMVDAAYHSRHMSSVADRYKDLLQIHVEWPTHPAHLRKPVMMFSSTLGKLLTEAPGPEYWVQNMVSPVLFSQAVQGMTTYSQHSSSIDCLIEIGPTNALSGPINQIQKAMSSSIKYMSAWKRGPDAVQAMLELAGKLFIMGYPICLAAFNEDDDRRPPMFISDLPNYVWNHSIKHWYESESSTDWRYRKFLHHDLLGSKILGTPWNHPIWKNVLRIGEVTWLQDHLLGESVVFPAAAFIAMAMEAIFQKTKATGHIPEDATVNRVTYKLRNVSFPRMLTLDRDHDTKIQLSLQACSSTRESWHEFTISTINRDGSGRSDEHSYGLVSIGEHPRPDAAGEDIEPLRHPVPAALWYKSMRNVGYNFGPAFQSSIAIESKAESRQCRALISLDAPTSHFPQSDYALHPASIDGALQIATVALNRGHRSAINTLLPPALIDDLVIFPQSKAARGIVSSSATWSGVGRPDDNKRFMSDIRLFAETSHEMLLHLQGLRYHAINASSDKPHEVTQVIWSEDIDFLTTSQLLEVLRGASSENNEVALVGIAKLIALMAHKRPSMRLLEIVCNDDQLPCQSLWIEHLRGKAGQIAGGCSYHLSTPGEKSGLNARERYAGEGNINYLVHDDDTPFGRENGAGHIGKFDMIILKTSCISVALRKAMENAQQVLTKTGFLAVVQDLSTPADNGMNSEPEQIENISPRGFESISCSAGTSPLRVKYLGGLRSNDAKAKDPKRDSRNVHLARFDPRISSNDTVRNLLAGYGWVIAEHNLPLDAIPSQSTVLVIDEMFFPVLSNISDGQFAALRDLLERNCQLLWVTVGSQMIVTHPELGLMFGAARSLQAEYPTNRVLCLDVESSSKTASLKAIHTVLKYMTSADDYDFTQLDHEFVERNGMFYISRVVADHALNIIDVDSQEALELRHDIIQGHQSIIRLVSERPGTLDALVYAEAPNTPPLQDDEVEIEVQAAGLNFKDLANAMGFVPANEHQFGLECTGIVIQIGKDVSTVKPGDRVLMVARTNGCFANRARNRWLAVYPLADWISFEEGTTLGIAVHTVVYGLVMLANVQKGQSVLIHSASGGVGLAAIDLCKYLGAEIFVTVGTDAKRDFLETNYGIPKDHMFSSRSTTFAPELMKATKGRGVDVCLNSLTGDMLHESWRCIAENGNLIEIGKKDMLSRNSLSMEPFDRNCSYRALDLSRKSITDLTTRKIGLHIMDLVSQGHLKPLHICKVFRFEEITEAFRYMQRGKHIGKVVISYENSKSVRIPFRPAALKLQMRANGSYLIVGGLKGLCGSLAVYLARQGARTIVVISRSGYDDPKSQKVVYDCNSLGCRVDLIRGDVTSMEDVRGAFKNASTPIVGIIQGAMVLRDRMFNTMTPQEFREAIAPKEAGTWNLHSVAQEQKQPLDFFTMLSSVSGLVGQLGQSNYAAGNVFLDNFAAFRLQQGLPACSINLGPIEDVGYLTDKDILNRAFEARGWTLINEALLHRILRISILQQTNKLNPKNSGQIVTAILPGKPPFEPLHRFSALRPAAGTIAASATGGGTATSNSTKLAMLKNAGKGEVDAATLLVLAMELVNAVLKRSLGISEDLEPTRPLANYGVDSLAAVELRNWVRAELGVEISALEVVGARTLTMLCEVILKKLLV